MLGSPHTPDPFNTAGFECKSVHDMFLFNSLSKSNFYTFRQNIECLYSDEIPASVISYKDANYCFKSPNLQFIMYKIDLDLRRKELLQLDIGAMRLYGKGNPLGHKRRETQILREELESHIWQVLKEHIPGSIENHKRKKHPFNLFVPNYGHCFKDSHSLLTETTYFNKIRDADHTNSIWKMQLKRNKAQLSDTQWNYRHESMNLIKLNILKDKIEFFRRKTMSGLSQNPNSSGSCRYGIAPNPEQKLIDQAKLVQILTTFAELSSIDYHKKTAEWTSFFTRLRQKEKLAEIIKATDSKFEQCNFTPLMNPILIRRKPYNYYDPISIRRSIIDHHLKCMNQTSEGKKHSNLLHSTGRILDYISCRNTDISTVLGQSENSSCMVHKELVRILLNSPDSEKIKRIKQIILLVSSISPDLVSGDVSPADGHGMDTNSVNRRSLQNQRKRCWNSGMILNQRHKYTIANGLPHGSENVLLSNETFKNDVWIKKNSDIAGRMQHFGATAPNVAEAWFTACETPEQSVQTMTKNNSISRKDLKKAILQRWFSQCPILPGELDVGRRVHDHKKRELLQKTILAPLVWETGLLSDLILELRTERSNKSVWKNSMQGCYKSKDQFMDSIDPNLKYALVENRLVLSPLKPSGVGCVHPPQAQVKGGLNLSDLRDRVSQEVSLKLELKTRAELLTIINFFRGSVLTSKDIRYISEFEKNFQKWDTIYSRHHLKEQKEQYRLVHTHKNNPDYNPESMEVEPLKSMVKQIFEQSLEHPYKFSLKNAYNILKEDSISQNRFGVEPNHPPELKQNRSIPNHSNDELLAISFCLMSAITDLDYPGLLDISQLSELSVESVLKTVPTPTSNILLNCYPTVKRTHSKSVVRTNQVANQTFQMMQVEPSADVRLFKQKNLEVFPKLIQFIEEHRLFQNRIERNNPLILSEDEFEQEAENIQVWKTNVHQYLIQTKPYPITEDEYSKFANDRSKASEEVIGNPYQQIQTQDYPVLKKANPMLTGGDDYVEQLANKIVLSTAETHTRVCSCSTGRLLQANIRVRLNPRDSKEALLSKACECEPCHIVVPD